MTDHPTTAHLPGSFQPCAGARWIACAFAFIAIACGGSDFVVQLPGGYELLRTNAPSVMIEFDGMSGEGVVVPPCITELEVHDRLIYGSAQKVPASDVPSRGGYFLIDSQTHTVSTGLTKPEWLALLRTHGIAEEPSLRSASSFAGRPSLEGMLWQFLALVALALAVVVSVARWRKRRRVCA